MNFLEASTLAKSNPGSTLTPEANSELNLLTQKLKRVSKEDWQKIEAREQAERKKIIEQELNGRNTVKCQCAGMVENCHFCFGSGTYIVDGHGNKK